MTSLTALAALAALLSSDPLPSLISPGQLTELGAELLIDEPGDGQTWARGPQWKASFGPNGMTFIPFFGSDAPQNYPIEFDLTEVSLGGEALPLEERTRTRSDQTVMLSRGTMTEVYHLAKDSVEQTFVFEDLPVRQELVLELDVDTELQPEPFRAGFMFSGGLGQVHYGGATAIDAAGVTLALYQELTNDGIRIVVPEHFVAAAEFPIVVDPVVSTFDVETGSRRQIDVDVAYDDNNGNYQIVFAEVQSVFDTDVIAVNYNVSLNLLLPSSAIDITSANWQTPRNASNFDEQQFLCVASVGFTVGNERIWGRTIESGSGAAGPQFTISGPGATNPDVGGKGNAFSSLHDYMVVWQEADTFSQDFDIVAQAVEAHSTLTGGRIIIDGDADNLDRRPSISKSSGPPSSLNSDNDYMIVWEREISPTNHDLRAVTIRFSGSTLNAGQFSAYTFSDALEPDVSSQNSSLTSMNDAYWVIAFRRRIGSDYKIFTVVARDGDADNARSVQTMQNLEVDGNHTSPQIAYAQGGYFIAYQSEGANGDHNVHMTVAHVIEDDGELRVGLSERRNFLAVSDGEQSRIGLATLYDGGYVAAGNEDGGGLLAWTARDNSTADTDVAAALIVDDQPPAIGSQFCEANLTSTGQSAWILATSPAVPNFPAVSLTCSDMPTNSFGHFIVSNQSGFVANPGGSQGNLCLQGNVGRFNRPGEVQNSGPDGTFSLSFNWNNLPSPSGTVAGQFGETWFFQTWFRDIGPSSNFSNAVDCYRF